MLADVLFSSLFAVPALVYCLFGRVKVWIFKVFGFRLDFSLPFSTRHSSVVDSYSLCCSLLHMNPTSYFHLFGSGEPGLSNSSLQTSFHSAAEGTRRN